MSLNLGDAALQAPQGQRTRDAPRRSYRASPLAEGVKVMLVHRQREALEKVAAELASDRTLEHVTDVSDSKAVEAMVSAVVRFGRLDVLVNNTGVHAGGDPRTIKSKGSIVNTASVSGTGSDCGMAQPADAPKLAVACQA